MVAKRMYLGSTLFGQQSTAYQQLKQNHSITNLPEAEFSPLMR